MHIDFLNSHTILFSVKILSCVDVANLGHSGTFTSSITSIVSLVCDVPIKGSAMVM